jgi:hypothetical protein
MESGTRVSTFLRYLLCPSSGQEDMIDGYQCFRAPQCLYLQCRRTFSALNMEAAYSSKTSVWSTRLHCSTVQKTKDVHHRLISKIQNTCLKNKQRNKLTLWSWALIKRPPVVKPIKNFPAFYAILRFNIAFTRALHLSPSWARPIQSTPPHPICPSKVKVSTSP